MSEVLRALKETLFQNCASYTAQGLNDLCSKRLLAKKMSVMRNIRPRGKIIKFEYLGEINTESKTNFGYDSGVHMGSIHEINSGRNLVLLSL
jgi:hypothetical protein